MERDFLHEIRGSVLLLLFLISLTVIVLGYKYYRHTQESPEFCLSCHLMKEAYKTWQRSRHSDIVCQTCHRLSLIEQNRLLVAFVAGKKSVTETHGRQKPWQSCKKCHFPDIEQGAISDSKTFGHARHVFSMKITCNECHLGELHEFKPESKACMKCHRDKLVHGLGMEGLQCLNCHTFSKEPSQKLASEKRCLQCHNVPKTGPMSALRCFDCHKPHGMIKLKGSDCLGRCHSHELEVGQHRLHVEKAKVDCLFCHKAHTWRVGRKLASRICTKCHAYRDPSSFIF
ncbi:MAG: NapC/NirT family cytochrome c [Thermodesulfovibrionales bacterium]|nr:NapC/NirT family cytochrome c [Thermodesulfovibrionales bacterium]